MKVAIIGASGWLGGEIAREAMARAHEVTAIGRDASRLEEVGAAHVAEADVTDPAALKKAIAGHDAVVSAVTDRTTFDRSLIPLTVRTLLEVLPEAGVDRLLVVGNGGSLEVEDGVRAVDHPDFPKEQRREALAHAEALEILRDSDTEVDWTYMSPPPYFLVPGPATRVYRVEAGDRAIIDDQGESGITSGDFAAAFVDELEYGRYSRRRFTAGS